MTDEVEVQDAALDESTIEGEKPEVEQESPEVTAASDSEVSTEVDEKQLALNKIAFEKREEKRQRIALEKELEALKAQTKQAEPVKELTLEAFDYDEQAYNAALIKNEVNKGVEAIKQQQVSEQAAIKQAEIQTKFNAKVTEFKKKATDYDRHVVNLPEFEQDTLNTILQMDDGPEVALYLAKHADIADQVASMSPTSAALTLGKISSQLASAKPKPKPSAAPDPIDPISNGGAATSQKDDPLIAGATFE